MAFRLALILTLTAAAVCGQDSRFLNTNQSLVNLNPSFAGSNGGLRNQFSYKNYWPSIFSSYTSLNNSLDFFVKSLNGGVGLTVQHEDFLKVNTNSAFGVAYAQHFKLNDGKGRFVPSLEAFYRRRTVDFTSMRFGSMTTFTWNGAPIEPVMSTEYLDVNVGLLYSYLDRLYAGIAISHITGPEAGVTESQVVDRQYKFYGSYNFLFSESALLQVQGTFVSQGNYHQAGLGANIILWKHLMTGVAYYSADALQVNAGFRANTFALNIGYDLTVSKLAGNTAGSWELHASYNLRNKENRKHLTSFEKL